MLEVGRSGAVVYYGYVDHAVGVVVVQGSARVVVLLVATGVVDENLWVIMLWINIIVLSKSCV